MQPDASRRQARSFRHAASPLLDEDFESCTPLPVSPDRSAAHARTLLTAGQPVRAVARDANRAAPWAARGCDVALADMTDTAALTTAFSNTAGVFVLLPPCFDPSPGFPETRAVIDAVGSALRTAQPRKVVCLSTIGAQATQVNLLTQLTMIEQAFGDLPMPVAFLRPRGSSKTPHGTSRPRATPA